MELWRIRSPETQGLRRNNSLWIFDRSIILSALHHLGRVLHQTHSFETRFPLFIVELYMHATQVLTATVSARPLIRGLLYLIVRHLIIFLVSLRRHKLRWLHLQLLLLLLHLLRLYILLLLLLLRLLGCTSECLRLAGPLLSFYVVVIIHHLVLVLAGVDLCSQGRLRALVIHIEVDVVEVATDELNRVDACLIVEFSLIRWFSCWFALNIVAERRQLEVVLIDTLDDPALTIPIPNILIQIRLRLHSLHMPITNLYLGQLAANYLTTTGMTQAQPTTHHHGLLLCSVQPSTLLVVTASDSAAPSTTTTWVSAGSLFWGEAMYLLVEEVERSGGVELSQDSCR